MQDETKSERRKLFAALRARLAVLRPLAPALARQLEGVDIASLRSASISSACRCCANRICRRCSAPRRRSAASRRRRPAASSALFLRRARSSRRRISATTRSARKAALEAAGFRRGRRRAQLLRLSPDARRLHHGERRACAGLRGDPGRPRQHRADLAGDRATAARRLLRAAGLSSRSCSTRPTPRASTFPRCARRSSPARRCPLALRAELEARGVRTRQAYATRRARRHRLRDRRPRRRLARAKSRRGHPRRNRRPGSGDPVPSARSARSSSRRCAAHFPLLRFATGDLSAFLARSRESAAGWAAPIRRPRSRACSSTRRKSSRSASAIPSSARCGLSCGARASRTR